MFASTDKMDFIFVEGNFFSTCHSSFERANRARSNELLFDPVPHRLMELLSQDRVEAVYVIPSRYYKGNKYTRICSLTLADGDTR